MSVRLRSKIVGVLTLAFVAVPGGLTAFRAWDLGPPTVIQSPIIDTDAALVVAGVVAHIARGENTGTHAGEGIILVFGSCLGLAANLFVPVSAIESPPWVAYPPVAGTALALAVDGVGTAVGYIVRVV